MTWGGASDVARCAHHLGRNIRVRKAGCYLSLFGSPRSRPQSKDLNASCLFWR